MSDFTAREMYLYNILASCLEFADEGWGYASDFFREKWDYAGQRNFFEKVLEEYTGPEPKP